MTTRVDTKKRNRTKQCKVPGEGDEEESHLNHVNEGLTEPREQDLRG